MLGEVGGVDVALGLRLRSQSKALSPSLGAVALDPEQGSGSGIARRVAHSMCCQPGFVFMNTGIIDFQNGAQFWLPPAMSVASIRSGIDAPCMGSPSGALRSPPVSEMLPPGASFLSMRTSSFLQT